MRRVWLMLGAYRTDLPMYRCPSTGNSTLGFKTVCGRQLRMPGAGRSESRTMGAIGALVAAIAVVGYLLSGWSFSGSEHTIPTAIGVVVAASAIGWTLYRRVFLDERL